ncbi:hypothetical protein HDN1F_35470 [gamma proteobacterium HdN1]|nr:Hypothetical protein HDN1F_17720 [gamma proteobacterium HdN1]CBL47130.1 hypothetical protein HDN1F_35470 [gamma proteobacterium HdN1]
MPLGVHFSMFAVNSDLRMAVYGFQHRRTAGKSAHHRRLRQLEIRSLAQTITDPIVFGIDGFASGLR